MRQRGERERAEGSVAPWSSDRLRVVRIVMSPRRNRRRRIPSSIHPTSTLSRIRAMSCRFGILMANLTLGSSTSDSCFSNLPGLNTVFSPNLHAISTIVLVRADRVARCTLCLSPSPSCSSRLFASSCAPFFTRAHVRARWRQREGEGGRLHKKGNIKCIQIGGLGNALPTSPLLLLLFPLGGGVKLRA